MKSIATFIKKEPVLSIATILAVLSMFFVIPSKEYLTYIDFRTLELLLCFMLVVAGFQDIGAFSYLGMFLLSKTKNPRQLSGILIFLCFFTSMLITNDVALLTFVPFTIMLLKMAKREDLFIPVIVLQTIGANLGSMLTPIGNPQNLYLYSLYEIPMVKFLLCLSCVLHLLSSHVMLLLILLFMFLIHRSLLLKADYKLLLTFVAFFIFIGNMERISLISETLRNLIYQRELVLGVVLSQVISNSFFWNCSESRSSPMYSRAFAFPSSFNFANGSSGLNPINSL